MNAIKQFLSALFYICLVLAILAFAGLAYLFTVNISGHDISFFVEEQKVNVAILSDKSKIIAGDMAVVANNIKSDFVSTTKEIHLSAMEIQKARDLAANPPPVEVLPIEAEEENIFSSDIFFSTAGENMLVFYNQLDEPWASSEYEPNITLDKYGCGPTSMSMVISTLLQSDITPVHTAKWSYDNGYSAGKSGSYHALIPDISTEFGLNVTSLKAPTSFDIINELNQGNLIVVLMGQGTFADAGHFIVIRDYTNNGQLLVADPQSFENSQIPWDSNIIINEAKYYANSGGPFWSISNIPTHETISDGTATPILDENGVPLESPKPLSVYEGGSPVLNEEKLNEAVRNNEVPLDQSVVAVTINDGVEDDTDDSNDDEITLDDE